jgi:hypothetical protein
VIAAAKGDETAVAVIQMEVSSEVRWVGFIVETAILAAAHRSKSRPASEMSFRAELQKL